MSAQDSSIVPIIKHCYGLYVSVSAKKSLLSGIILALSPLNLNLLTFYFCRLEGETGRASCEPVFIVGAYSGTEKIGESFGPSLKDAELRACRDALLRYYCMEEEPDMLDHLPAYAAPHDAPRPFPIYDSHVTCLRT